MEITAFITLTKCLGTMKLTSFIPVISLVHVAQAWNKLKAVFPLAQFAYSTFRISVIEFVDTFLIAEFPVKLIL